MSAGLDRILTDAVARGDLMGAAAAIVTPRGMSIGAAGLGAENAPMTPDTIVWIASMTKAITTAAAMQLVEQGRLDLDAPSGELVPYLGDVQVLHGFAEDGEALLRPPQRPMTLRHLLTHTSGFGYTFTDARLARYSAHEQRIGRAAYELPLLFDPGEKWAYGIGIDWVGRIIEAVTGTRLDRHLQDTILDPLEMNNTGFRFATDLQGPPPAIMWSRTSEGLVPVPFDGIEDPTFVKGGSGLHGTVVDYLRFVRMILGGGQLDGVRILADDTVRTMATNHIGALPVTGWRTADAFSSNDVDFFPGMLQKWGLSFLINTETTHEGRSPGSLAWAGLANTYYWIDPTSEVGGVFATQTLPFFDGPALDAFRAVERFAYSEL